MNTDTQPRRVGRASWSTGGLAIGIVGITLIYFYLAVHFGHGAWRTDTWFHLMRIWDLNIATRQHHLPDIVNITSFLGLGQAFNAMYPPYFLYPLVALTRGLNGLLQWYAIQSLIVFIGLWLAAFGFRRAGGRVWSSLLFGTVTVLSQGFVAYTDSGSLGMMIGSAMLPGALMATYNVVKKGQYRDILALAVPVAITLNSHLATAVLMVLVIVIIAITQSLAARTWSIFGRFSLAGGLALLLSLPAWLMPIVMAPSHLSSVRLIPLKGASLLGIVQQTFTLNKVSLMSWLGLIALVYVPWRAIKYHQFQAGRVYYLLGALLFYLSTNLFPWSLMPTVLANVIQGVEWRLLAMAATLLVTAGFIQSLDTLASGTQREHRLLLTLTLIGFVVPMAGITLTLGQRNRALPAWQPQDGYYHHADNVLTPASFQSPDFYRLRWYTDYLPETTPKASFGAQVSVSAHQAVVDGKIFRVPRAVDPNSHAITFTLPQATSDWVDLPFWYYSSLHYQIPNVRQIKQSTRGSVLVKLDKPANQVTVQRVSSPLYRPAVWVMLLAWLGALGLWGAQRFRLDRREKTE